MIKYEAYAYIAPPRAETKIMEAMLGFYEKRGWIAQIKKNGTNSVIYVPPKSVGRPFAKTRHAEDPEHKVWQFTEKSIAAFEEIQGSRWYVFNAELMHSKGHGYRDTNYVHDILVHDGRYMLGTTVAGRQTLLRKIFGVIDLKGPRSHYVYNDNTWIVKNHTNGFQRLFGQLENEDEGLVLKNPEGLLTTRDNGSWAVKCRHPHKNFGF
jgi:hypothetical protein